MRGPHDLPGRRPSTHYLPGRWLCPSENMRLGDHHFMSSPPPTPRPRLPGKTGRTFRREATPSTGQEKRGGRGLSALRWLRGRTSGSTTAHHQPYRALKPTLEPRAQQPRAQQRQDLPGRSDHAEKNSPPPLNTRDEPVYQWEM